MATMDELLDYEEEQEETQVHAKNNQAATNGEAAKKVKVYIAQFPVPCLVET
jgi:hypothetical protein